MARTTVILKENLMLEVKQLARAKQTTTTQIIHEALTAYVEAVKTATLPSFVAAGVAESDLSRKAPKRFSVVD